jgi:hypothetical protein
MRGEVTMHHDDLAPFAVADGLLARIAAERPGGVLLRPFQADLARTMRAPEPSTGRLRARGAVEVAPYPKVTALLPKWITGERRRP